MIVQWLYLFTAFVILITLTMTVLHLVKYKKGRACACGHQRTCTSKKPGSCR